MAEVLLQHKDLIYELTLFAIGVLIGILVGIDNSDSRRIDKKNKKDSNKGD